MDAATVGALCTGVAAIIAAVGAVVKIVLTRPRLPVAEELLKRMSEIEDELLAWAGWGHTVRMLAAGQGLELPPIPGKLAASGRRAEDHPDRPHRRPPHDPPRRRYSDEPRDERNGDYG